MGRKQEDVFVPAWGSRDDGKVFRITEMPAAQAEKWAWRSIIALKGTSGFIPEESEKLGMIGIAIRGMNAFLGADIEFRNIEPLLDEMMTCVTIVRDHTRHPDIATPIVMNDIEEVRTIGWLRSEVLRVHTGFSLSAALSALAAALNSQPDSQTT